MFNIYTVEGKHVSIFSLLSRNEVAFLATMTVVCVAIMARVW